MTARGRFYSLPPGPYTQIWLLSRDPSSPNPLLSATAIDAVVLAPDAYYARYHLAGLQRALDGQIAARGAEHGVQLSFRFETFSPWLDATALTDANVLTMIDTRRRL